MKTLDKDDYHLLFAYYRLASEAQEEVRKYTKEIARLLGEGKEEALINDAVYDPLVGSSKKDYVELLEKADITVEWKLAQNEFAKQQRRDEKEKVE